MRQSLKASLNAVSTTYGMFDIYGAKRTEMTAKALGVFQKDMERFGIIIENMNLMAVRPDKASMEAIQQKINAIQTLEKAKVDKETALVTAQQNLEVAKKTAEQQFVLAEGEAKANQALAASMTDQLVRYKQLEVQKAQAEAMHGWQVQYYIQGGSPDSMILPSPALNSTK
jgi:regulator of protease activity HflC (stomatin/prohibitin superfamily)